LFEKLSGLIHRLEIVANCGYTVAAYTQLLSYTTTNAMEISLYSGSCNLCIMIPLLAEPNGLHLINLLVNMDVALIIMDALLGWMLLLPPTIQVFNGAEAIEISTLRY
jgi:hypothetical protein